MWRSEPQMAVAVTRMMASRWSSIFGIVDGFDANVAGFMENEGFHCGRIRRVDSRAGRAISAGAPELRGRKVANSAGAAFV